MAFLSHEIPWQTIASNLYYKPARSGPGPQQASIRFDQEVKEKALEYFARTLQEVIRSHACVERTKYRPSSDYITRAKVWTVSSDDSGRAAVSVAESLLQKEEEVQQPDDANARRQNRNRQLRLLQTSLSNGWCSQAEQRHVYPEDFLQKYGRVLDGDEYQRWSMSFIQEKRGMNISEWLEHMPQDWQQSTQLYDKSLELNDVLKLLITDAAITNCSDRQKYLIETLFLLAHHPQIDLERFNPMFIECCMLGCAFDQIAVHATQLFLFLNILVSMQQDPVNEKLFQAVDFKITFDRHGEQVVPKRVQEFDQAKNNNSVIALMPRPRYMNLGIWNGLVKQISHEHLHRAENLMFRMLLFPPNPDRDTPRNDNLESTVQSDERKQKDQTLPRKKTCSIEIDPLSDHATLKDIFKVLWKTIIIVEVIRREIGSPWNWECVLLQAIHELFGWPGEWRRYYEYEAAREGDFRLNNTPNPYGRYEVNNLSWPDGIAE